MKNITDNEIIEIRGNAIKNKNKLTYRYNNDIYTVKILSPKKITLQRNNDLINSTLIFEENLKTSSIYYIKKEDITLEINIKTTKIILSNNIIDITYTIIDSNIDYQYKIEMSE